MNKIETKTGVLMLIKLGAPGSIENIEYQYVNKFERLYLKFQRVITKHISKVTYDNKSSLKPKTWFGMILGLFIPTLTRSIKNLL